MSAIQTALEGYQPLIGTEVGVSKWYTVDQKMIDEFAETTIDTQWIHVDPEKAAAGPFGKTIAHGYLTLSLANLFLPQIMEVKNTSMGVNYGTEKTRFPSPVTVGSNIRATGEIMAVEENKGGYKATIRVTITAEGADRPACIVDTISIFYP